MENYQVFKQKPSPFLWKHINLHRTWTIIFWWHPTFSIENWIRKTKYAIFRLSLMKKGFYLKFGIQWIFVWKMFFDLDFWKTAPYFLLTTKLFWKYEHCRVEWYMTQPYIIHDDYILEIISLITGLKCRDNIQLMTFHEVNTRIDQPMEMIFTEAA